MELRRLVVEDWMLWRDVRLRALTQAPDAFGATLADWQGEGDVEERWRDRLAGVPLNVVAAVHGFPVGQVSGTALDANDRCELISMWVDTSVRGTGVGQTLVGAVVDWARSNGASAVVLSVRQDNRHAVDLYTRAGFVPIDEPADDGCDLRMQRDLERTSVPERGR